MSGKKKKMSVRLKSYNIVLIVALIVFMILLGVLLVIKMFGNSNYYRVESRKDNIEKSKKQDRSDYETIGWIRVQGTNIDYPLYGIIEESYEYPVTDSYLWSLNMDSKFHSMMVVYGHNIMNLGKTPLLYDDSFERFEELLAFVDYDFAKENLYFQYTMNGEDHLYKIFAVDVFDSLNMSGLPTGNFTTKEFNDHVKMLRRNSIYDYDVNVTSNDDIVSLITCTGLLSDGYYYNDIVVTGKLVVNGLFFLFSMSISCLEDKYNFLIFKPGEKALGFSI